MSLVPLGRSKGASALHEAIVKVVSDRSLNINNIFFNAFDETQQVQGNLKTMKILKTSATRWLSHENSTKGVIEIFEEIVDSLDAIYEKLKDTEGVRDALLHHMILRHAIRQPVPCRSLANK